MRVGDYVRSESGLIGKIIGFKGDMVETDNKRLITYKNNHNECKIKERPIDLIEVGDYVNGIYIDIIEKEQKRVWHTSCYGDDDIVFYNNDIKSIVTKEQFENCMYKVGEQ